MGIDQVDKELDALKKEKETLDEWQEGYLEKLKKKKAKKASEKTTIQNAEHTAARMTRLGLCLFKDNNEEEKSNRQKRVEAQIALLTDLARRYEVRTPEYKKNMEEREEKRKQMMKDKDKSTAGGQALKNLS